MLEKQLDFYKICILVALVLGLTGNKAASQPSLSKNSQQLHCDTFHAIDSTFFIQSLLESNCMIKLLLASDVNCVNLVTPTQVLQLHFSKPIFEVTEDEFNKYSTKDGWFLIIDNIHQRWEYAEVTAFYTYYNANVKKITREVRVSFLKSKDNWKPANCQRGDTYFDF